MPKLTRSEYFSLAVSHRGTLHLKGTFKTALVALDVRARVRYWRQSVAWMQLGDACVRLDAAAAVTHNSIDILNDC